MIKYRALRKIIAVVSNISLLLNSFLPYLIIARPIYAQDAEISPTATSSAEIASATATPTPNLTSTPTPTVSPAGPVDICAVDAGGVNDVPGQKDLTKMCYRHDTDNLLKTSWNWDDISWSGQNTGDACNLFDTDNDGKVNYAVCVTIGGDSAAIQSTTRYSCGNDKSDRCTSPIVLLPVSPNTTCSVSPSSDDPFPTGDFSPNDTKASCNIDLADVGGVSSAKLVDVCSYPSQQPNSDPSDCIIAITGQSGELEIKKVLVPPEDPGKFNLLIGSVSYVSNIGNGGTTGKVSLSPGTYDVSESAGSNTNLTDYSSTISCVNTKNNSEVVSGSGPGPIAVVVDNNSSILCTITNTAIPKSTLIVKKHVINDNGGNKNAGDFTLNVGNTSFPGNEQGTAVSLAAGTYSVTENSSSAYSQTGSDCTDITLLPGETKTCTITNDDNPAKLIVKKIVNNRADGTKQASDFSFSLNNQDPIPFNFTGQNEFILNTGTSYSIIETSAIGYTASYDNCQNLSLVNGQTTTCTITNTDTDYLPSVEVAKTASVFSLTEPGGNVIYNFTIKNTSPADAVTITSLQDDRFGNLVGSPDCHVGTILPIGNSCSFSLTQLIQGDPVNPHTNTFTAFVKDDENNYVSDSAIATVTFTDAPPAVNLEKTVDKTSLPEPGGQFIFTLTATNNSLESVTITNLTDSYPLSAECTGLIGQIIAPGQSVSCHYSVSHSEAGSYPNTAVVQVVDNEGDQAFSTDSQQVEVTDIHPNISLTKDAEVSTISEPGGLVKFSLVVTNNSIESVTLSSLVDNIYGNLNGRGNCLTPQTINPGQNYHCTFEGNVGPDPGIYTDVVTAVAIDDEQNPTSAHDDAAVNVTRIPGLKLVKSVVNDNGGTASPSDWQLTATDGISGFTVAGDNQKFYKINPGTAYTLSESGPDGYYPQGWSCDGGHLENNQITLSSEDNVTCTAVNNDSFAKVIVTKYNDRNGNGVKDENEEVLSGWDINLSAVGKTTDNNGQAIFSQLLPGEEYRLSEILQPGWRQTNIFCGNDTDINRTNNYLLGLSREQTLNCFIGNQLIPSRLTIAKFNSNWPGSSTVGSDIQYSLVLNVSNNNIHGLTVIDLPPAGFKYKPGSYQVKVNGVVRSIPEPVYHSPGKWQIGDLNSGDVVTLNYLAVIDDSVDPGIYKDAAWAYACQEAETCSLSGPDRLLAVSVDSGKTDSGILTANFVGSKVQLDPVAAGSEANIIHEESAGQVLGASTDLPSTGSDAVWIVIGLILFLLGTVSLNYGLHPQNMKFKTFILFLIIFLSLPVNKIFAVADQNIFIGIENPSSPTNKDKFNLSFTALDILGRPLTIKCFKINPDSSQVQLGSDFIIKAGGNSGQCSLDNQPLTENGKTYQFYATASADGESYRSDTVAVFFDTNVPGTPTEYSKNQDGFCRYQINFRASNDGRTNRIQIYRSDVAKFIADAGSKIGEVGISPDQKGSFTDVNVPDCHKTFYYVIRAFDAGGNGSGLVGDSVTVYTTTVTTTTPVVNQAQSQLAAAIPVAGDNNIPPEETPVPNASDSGRILGSEDVRESFISRHKILLGLISSLLLIILSYGINRFRSKKR